MSRHLLFLWRLLGFREQPVPTGPIECMGGSVRVDPDAVRSARAIAMAQSCFYHGDAAGYAFWVLRSAGFTRETSETTTNNEG